MNPFRLLKVGRYVAPAELLAAAARALRERQHPAREVALAQKELLDPVSRACHAFISFLEPSQAEPPLGPAPLDSLGYLDIFERR